MCKMKRMSNNCGFCIKCQKKSERMRCDVCQVRDSGLSILPIPYVHTFTRVLLPFTRVLLPFVLNLNRSRFKFYVIIFS